MNVDGVGMELEEVGGGVEDVPCGAFLLFNLAIVMRKATIKERKSIRLVLGVSRGFDSVLFEEEKSMAFDRRRGWPLYLPDVIPRDLG